MTTVNEFIRKRLLKDVPDRVPDLNELRQIQRCKRFECMCSNRMVQGAMRYGLLRNNSGEKFDSVGSIIARAKKYQKDGKAEHLCDIANLAMVEFSTKQRIQRVSSEEAEHAMEV